MTAEAFKTVLSDFLSDLHDLSVDDVERACMIYRLDSKNRFFPTPGQLRAALKPQKMSWELPEKRRETWREPHFEQPAQRLSVSEVLRKHGHDRAADAWEARMPPKAHK